MKFLYLLLIIVSTELVGACQSSICEATVYWQHQNPIGIYDFPDGNLINSLRNYVEEEDFIHMDIHESSDTYFLVSISLNMSDTTYCGWIRKERYIGTWIRHEAYPTMSIVLFGSGSKPSTVDTFEIENWKPSFLTILTCSNGWVLVEMDYKGGRMKGWILREELCANSYTTCN